MSFACRVNSNRFILLLKLDIKDVRCISTICNRYTARSSTKWQRPSILRVMPVLHHLNSVSFGQLPSQQNALELFDFQNDWPADDIDAVKRDMIVLPNFISEAEEKSLHDETEKTMKRMRYQYDHWDDAIHGYREMEKIEWWPENETVFKRLRERAFDQQTLPHVHILDLAGDGIIKPHVDSSRYCGTTIAGISLLTDCVMRLKRTNENKYKQGKLDEDNTGASTIVPMADNATGNVDSENEWNYYVDILLTRRSLYIMKDSARYKFTHEVLPTKALFKGHEVVKSRRVSIICRNQP